MAQALFSANKPLVDGFFGRANDLANFSNAKALHHAQQEARDILRRKAREGGAHGLAFGKRVFKSGGSREGFWSLLRVGFQRLPANNPAAAQRRNATMIGRRKEPAPRRLWRICAAERRFTTTSNQ